MKNHSQSTVHQDEAPHRWEGPELSPLTVSWLLSTVFLFTACKHAEPQSQPQFSSLDAQSPVSPAAALERVSLPTKLEPAWLQPPSDLFTLGPGDRLGTAVHRPRQLGAAAAGHVDAADGARA